MEDDFHPESWRGKVKRMRLDGRKNWGMFSIRLATNGRQGGNQSHGARALVQIDNLQLGGSLGARVEGDPGEEQVIKLVVSGDLELQAFADALRWAGIKPGRAIKESDDDY